MVRIEDGEMVSVQAPVLGQNAPVGSKERGVPSHAIETRDLREPELPAEVCMAGVVSKRRKRKSSLEQS